MHHELNFRRIVSNYETNPGLVSRERAIDVLTSLIQKEQAGKLTDENRKLLEELKAAGYAE